MVFSICHDLSATITPQCQRVRSRRDPATDLGKVILYSMVSSIYHDKVSITHSTYMPQAPQCQRVRSRRDTASDLDMHSAYNHQNLWH